jgi:iron complex transport system permease protein
MSRRLPLGPTALSLACLLSLSLVLAVLLGETRISPAELVASPILWEIRLPRALLAALVGAALAASGAALQGLTGNPLADPYLLGAASGAAVGAGVAILLGLSATLFLPGFAFLGALGATALVFLLARSAPGRAGLLLAGVATGAFLAALMNLLLSLARQETNQVLLWLLGWLGGAEWWQVVTLAAVVPVGTILLAVLGRGLDAVSFGEETAHAVGIDVTRLRHRVILLTALLTATAVAFSGVIGFVGLLAPHAIRALVGPAHRPLVPLSALLGGALLVLADLLARAALPGHPLPIGVVTALLGAPVFALLLTRRGV